MNIPDEAVEAAARVAYAVKPAKYYLDDSVVTWDQLGDSRSGQLRKDQELSKMRAALEAAAPHLMAPILVLHNKSIGSYTDADGCRWTGDYCQNCRCEWPCATAEIIGVRL